MDSCPDTDNDPAMDCLFDMDNFHKNLYLKEVIFFAMSVSLIDQTNPKIGNELSLTTNYRSIPQHSLLS